ncbi:hypothetical protein MTO96_001461 [Rhipicephalus appendiculatus]
MGTVRYLNGGRDVELVCDLHGDQLVSNVVWVKATHPRGQPPVTWRPPPPSCGPCFCPVQYGCVYQHLDLADRRFFADTRGHHASLHIYGDFAGGLRCLPLQCYQLADRVGRGQHRDGVPNRSFHRIERVKREARKTPASRRVALLLLLLPLLPRTVTWETGKVLLAGRKFTHLQACPAIQSGQSIQYSQLRPYSHHDHVANAATDMILMQLLLLHMHQYLRELHITSTIKKYHLSWVSRAIQDIDLGIDNLSLAVG